jgi:catalase
MNISIDDVDLNLPKRDSHSNQIKANNMHPELNIPTEKVDSEVEIDTNTNDYIEPGEDPWLL